MTDALVEPVLAKTCAIERSFAQADLDAFAALSGDHNPLHVDPDFAAQGRFGRTIAHGVLVMTVLRGVADRLLPGWRLTNHQTRFQAPTFTDDPMRFAAGLVACDEAQATLTLTATRIADGTVTCATDAKFCRV